MRHQSKPLYAIAFGQTDLGLLRHNNEDSFLALDLTSGLAAPTLPALNHVVGEKGSLFLVADGMGGAEAGEVASRMAVEVVSQLVSEQLSKVPVLNRAAFVEILKESVRQANLAIYQESRNNKTQRGMGTTLTAAGVFDAAVFFAQVGDSRGYLMRNSSIAQMTQDQSLVARLVASGELTPEQAKDHPRRNVILQALGPQEDVDVAVSFADLKRDDRVILCSDGLSGKIDNEELKEVLNSFPDPQAACQRLVDIARERGGEDNITVIIVKFDGERLPLSLPGELPVCQPYHEKSPRWHFWTWGKR